RPRSRSGVISPHTRALDGELHRLCTWGYVRRDLPGRSNALGIAGGVMVMVVMMMMMGTLGALILVPASPTLVRGWAPARCQVFGCSDGRRIGSGPYVRDRALVSGRPDRRQTQRVADRPQQRVVRDRAVGDVAPLRESALEHG